MVKRILLVTASALAVTSGMAAAQPIATISGRVTSLSTSTPVWGMTVKAYKDSADDAFPKIATTDANGVYQLAGLSSGNYLVRTVTLPASPLVDQWYPGICLACPGARPKPVSVGVSQQVTGVDFALDSNSGAISGSVTLLQAVFEIRPDIQIYNADGALVKSVSLGRTEMVPPASQAPVAWTAAGLPAGTYYVRTSNPIQLNQLLLHVDFQSGPWIDELFDNIVCVAADCRPTTGTPVAVTAGATTDGVNFTLDSGASIGGGGTALFLGGLRFDIFDSRGVRLPNRIAPFFNGYVANGLPAGTYYLLAYRSDVNLSQTLLYPNIPCDGCSVTSGTPVTVAAGEDKSAPFLAPASAIGGISGTVTSDGSTSPPNQPLGSVNVGAYAPNGVLQASTSSNTDGSYRIGALAAGTYYVRTANGGSYVDRVYATLSCTGCDPTRGTAVTVTAGADTTGVDFALSPGTFVSGVLSASDGVPIFGAGVSFYTSTSASPAAHALSGGGGAFSTTLSQGTYFAQTDPVSGYGQQIYNGVACPQGICSTASATSIVVGATAVTGINFNLPVCVAPSIAPISLANAAVGIAYRQTLLATGATGGVRFAVSSGTLPPGLALDPGAAVISGTPTASGQFTFTVSAVDSTACGGSRSYTLDVPACVVNSSVPAYTTVVPALPAPWVVPFTSNCSSLTTTSNVPWITSVSIFGVGSVLFNTTWNTGDTRQGSFTVGSRVFTVSQSGVTDTPPFGSVDAPGDGAVVSGSVAISGWALDDHSVSTVSIWRDPVAGEPSQPIFIGNATFVSGARPDVATAYPTVPYHDRAGWGYLLLTNMLPNQGNGTFRILVYATDIQVGPPHRTLLGTRVINAVNASATAPFGAIDTPDQGATASGNAFVNFGWALTPQPKLIPFDGSMIDVLIDGVSVGTVTAYNFFRSDVSTLFPGLKNSGGPVGYRIIDTTALSEGLHTIAWIVTDDAGATNGIGSRYFTVQNSAWQPSLRAKFTAAPPAFSASEIAHADATTAVPARVDGVDLGRKAASLATLSLEGRSEGLRYGDRGARLVTMSSQQTLELPLTSVAQAFPGLSAVEGPPADACPATYAGYLVAAGELRALPVGSSLDSGGTFYWHPGPAFFGTYHVLFVRTSCDGMRQRVPVTIEIR